MPKSAQTVAELAIAQSRSGVISPQAALWALAASILVVPTPDAKPDGSLENFTPLLVGRDGQNFLVVFTLPEHVGRFRERAPQFLEIQGAEVVRRLPNGVGIAVNPETPLGFELPSDGVAALRAELTSSDDPAM